MLQQWVASGRQMLLGQQTPLRRGIILDKQVQRNADELLQLLRKSRGQRAFLLGLVSLGCLESFANAVGFTVLAGAVFGFLEKKGGCGHGR